MGIVKFKNKLQYTANIKNVNTATYSTVEADQNNTISITVACTVTVNTANMAVGSTIDVINNSNGTITFQAGVGVTLRSDSGYLDLTTKYSSASLLQIAANEWFITYKLANPRVETLAPWNDDNVRFIYPTTIITPITQSGLLRFGYDLNDALPGSVVFMQIIANGSGVFFDNMIEHSGSAGFDRTPGTTNLISLMYDGVDVYYTIQQVLPAPAPDVTPPTVAVSRIDVGEINTVTLIFSEEIDPNSISAADWKVWDDTSTPTQLTINSASLVGSELLLDIQQTLYGGKIYTVDYSGTSIQDIAGNKLVAFSDRPITNNLAIYNPSSYITHPIINWARARTLDGIISNGATMVSMSNAGTKGGATYIVSGTGPVYISNQLSGTGVLRFNGTNQAIRTSSAFVRKNIYTKFVVFKAVTGANGVVENHYSLFDQVAYGTTANRINNTTASGAGVTRTPSSQPNTTSTYGSTWVILAIRCGATSDTRKINGAVDHTQSATGGSAVDSGSNLHTIGFNGLGSYLNMDFAEAIIVEGEMADADIEKFEGYLAWTLGLQSSLAIGHPYKNNPPQP